MTENKFHGLSGMVNNIFALPHCETDRYWRKALGLTNEKYVKTHDLSFDECNNAFTKPKPPVHIDIIESLHKRSDYE